MTNDDVRLSSDVANSSFVEFRDDSLEPAVRGYLHLPANPHGDALILTHGAGSNCSTPLLLALSETFAGHGYVVLRCDLPFRQERRTGPPFPGNAERDRAGLHNAVAALRRNVTRRIFLGGHSYGGRQATMLCAAEPDVVKSERVSGLLLLSYPLHPPRKGEQFRIQHLHSLRAPSLFVHGTRDPFGSVEEMTKALQIIHAKTELMKVEGAGHDLGFKGKAQRLELFATIFAKFEEMFSQTM